MTQPVETLALPLSGCSFGWLHQAPLADALRALARHGFRSLELTTAPPHLFSPGFGPYERRGAQARTLAGLGLQVVSVNPSFADINLVSTNPEIREISERQLVANIELAADLGARFVVVIPGRRHALAPAPADAAQAVLDRGWNGCWPGPRSSASPSPWRTAPTVPRAGPPTWSRSWSAGTPRGCASPTTWPTRWRSRTQPRGCGGPAEYLALAHISDTWRTQVGPHLGRPRRGRLRRLRARPRGRSASPARPCTSWWTARIRSPGCPRPTWRRWRPAGWAP